jgi:hypothetical protein
LGNSLADCSQNVSTVIKVLKEKGFVVNIEMSSLFPKQVATYIGYLLNVREMTFTLPVGKFRFGGRFVDSDGLPDS